jgi:microcystin-dependent protein
MIMMWSGTVATIPSGWYLCNGSNSTPDLRNKFIIGANSDDAGVAKTSVEGAFTKSAGTKDATLVSHTHAATSTVTDPGHAHASQYDNRTPGSIDYVGAGDEIGGKGTVWTWPTTSAVTGISVGTTIATAGTSGTNANLPPYYALAFIMKG